MRQGVCRPRCGSYRDAVAGVTMSPPPPPISFGSASFRPMGTLTWDQGMKVLRFLDDEIARICVVGCLPKGFRGDFSVGAINFRHVFIKFTLEEDYTKLWIKLIWFVDGFPMCVFKWTPTFNLRVELAIISVWVRLPELPIQFFEREALFSIARLLGTPLRTDVSTATLVRPSVVCVCVEINLLEPLQTEIGLGFGTYVVIQRVVYEWLLKNCGACKYLGHAEEECYEKHKAKVPVRPVERDGQQMPGPAREDLRVKLDAQGAQPSLDDHRRGKSVAFVEHVTGPHPRASTSSAKGDGEETCGDVLHTDTPEPVMEEVVHSPEIMTGGTEGPSHVPPTTTLGVDH
ncbi:hypothetical protein Salat_2106300 [Sesamum alatum]|uniref:DUF4283 domain-containing protein n=1 Tax=Sesamum alatum TaxID=300844 RepID=A0AAE1Y1J8_9LAMI|nr:hypothetical protein Salat_2106300 [Sesamum alatum]